MADNNLRIEIDPRAMSKDDFDSIKGDIIKEIISNELTSDGETAWHVKLQHDKHIKVIIDGNGHPRPDDFDTLTVGDRLERIDMVLKDI